jgi:hypothetical protein
MSELATAPLEAVSDPELPFGVTPNEAAVLITISEGHTGVQVARQLEIEKGEADILRFDAMEKLGTPRLPTERSKPASSPSRPYPIPKS